MMDEETVAIARYDSPLEANLARAKLAAAGIETSLTNEMGAHLSPGAPGAIPIQLAVAREDAWRAVEILGRRVDEPAPEWSSVPKDPERCPTCESSFIEIRPPSVLGQIFRAILTSFVPIPASTLETKSRACGVCGHRWKARPPEMGEAPS
jgi:hypothetical protein